ncbi:hypothetical protein [Streptomyces albipurpureus]|uniref:Uncharacterized protein n=1 Tax=Streptomyces albipurpureus TaxID=2897419 RepID=A0ABT0UW92_9ACTN|nr:hypothetical protein [Streptomyces sp. CWNU-1]MCM2392701.1 hypothetical protein [Streptomyces sp. CWNU-1]
MNEEIKDKLRQHAGKILLGGTGALLALSVFTLASGLLSNGPAATGTQAYALVQKLEGNLGNAKTKLATQHAALLAQLPGMDIERVNRDRATGRSLLLSLTGSSASTRAVKEQQVLLDARYGFLDHESRVLTEFVPGWMTVTGATKGAGTTYTLGDLDINVSRVQGLNYSYTGVARLDPVRVGPAQNSAARGEFAVFTYSTSQDGTVTSLDVYLASSRTRDALAAAARNGHPQADRVSGAPAASARNPEDPDET